MTCIAHFDGGARRYYHTAGAGAVLYDRPGHLIWKGCRAIGDKNHIDAEYEGAILAIEEVSRRGLDSVCLRGDSLLVVMQLSGQWRIRVPRLRALARRFHETAKGINVTFEWVGREDNEDADEMSNVAIDEQEGRA